MRSNTNRAITSATSLDGLNCRVNCAYSACLQAACVLFKPRGSAVSLYYIEIRLLSLVADGLTYLSGL